MGSWVTGLHLLKIQLTQPPRGKELQNENMRYVLLFLSVLFQSLLGFNIELFNLYFVNF